MKSWKVDFLKCLLTWYLYKIGLVERQTCAPLCMEMEQTLEVNPGNVAFALKSMQLTASSWIKFCNDRFFLGARDVSVVEVRRFIERDHTSRQSTGPFTFLRVGVSTCKFDQLHKTMLAEKMFTSYIDLFPVSSSIICQDGSFWIVCTIHDTQGHSLNSLRCDQSIASGHGSDRNRDSLHSTCH